MPKKSSGLLVYRYTPGQPEVFLVHMGGPFWAKKDQGAWSIPKGEFEDEEDPLSAAIREFKEETGSEITGDFHPLEPIKQSGGKIVFAWSIEGDVDASTIKSNLFEMEWPPRSGIKKMFPEVDRAAWFSFSEAREKIIKGQQPLLDQLEKLLQEEKRR
jgi:predicted NUDIX family NTP pyrophosphohydrolase